MNFFLIKVDMKQKLQLSFMPYCDVFYYLENDKNILHDISFCVIKTNSLDKLHKIRLLFDM